jgi:hypothetical protein
MRNYWSCTKFADWVRGTSKLRAGTSDEWHDWEQQAKSVSRFRYWLAEEGLDGIQQAIHWIPDRLHGIKYYINNRWVTRTHALTAHPRDIKPGEWRDVGNRFLPCLFNELVDFVEVELAWWHIAWAEKDEKRKYDAPFWATGWFRWRTWRCPQAGLDNLEWQRSLTWSANELGDDNPSVGKRTQQAINADEILALYKWWKEVYPNRPDPHDASGWSEYCERKRILAKEKGMSGFSGMFSDRHETKELKKFGARALKLITQIEAKYEKEDEQMMIRLIKIRNSLWT